MKSAWMEKDKDKGSIESNNMNDNGTCSRVLHGDRARQLFEVVHKFMVGICDVMFTHRFAVLINETSANDYTCAIWMRHTKRNHCHRYRYRYPISAVHGLLGSKSVSISMEHFIRTGLHDNMPTKGLMVCNKRTTEEMFYRIKIAKHCCFRYCL